MEAFGLNLYFYLPLFSYASKRWCANDMHFIVSFEDSRYITIWFVLQFCLLLSVYMLLDFFTHVCFVAHIWHDVKHA